jgi:TRAP-type mannitol/chloroaromatic compound transport system permease small subunit/TRAP-type C4-dicarboxylate transport system substrate-binding protein
MSLSQFAGARRSVLKAGVVGAVAAPGVALAQASFNWKMTSAYGKGTPFYMDGPGSATDLAKRIREMSGGRLNIQVFGAGELIPAFEGFDAVRAGTVEMNHANSYFWTGKTAAAQYFCAVPFGLNFQGVNGWFYDGGGLELWNEVYAPFGMVALPCANTGVQMTGWFKKEINTVADLKGLKMRIPGLAGRVYASLGVDVKVLPGGEIFPALERGVIDAAEFVGPFLDRRLGLHKAAKYYYTTGWHETATVAEAAQGPAGHRRKRLGGLQRHQRSLVPETQLRGDGRPGEEPGRDRQALARRSHQGPAHRDRQGAGRGRGQGPDDEEGARVLHGLQDQVRPLVRGQRRGLPRQGPGMSRRVSLAVQRIEALIDLIGRATLYLTLGMIALVATNVLLRYAFSIGSVWAQELEWHLLAAVILLGMSYALQRGDNVRVDVFYADFKPRMKFFVNVLSYLLLLLIAAAFFKLSLTYVAQSYAIGEISADPGGIPWRWAIKGLIPMGFALLALQTLGALFRVFIDERERLHAPVLASAKADHV